MRHVFNVVLVCAAVGLLVAGYLQGRGVCPLTPDPVVPAPVPEPDPEPTYVEADVWEALAVLAEQDQFVGSEHFWSTVERLHAMGVLSDQAAGKFDAAFPELPETERSVGRDDAAKLRALR